MEQVVFGFKPDYSFYQARLAKGLTKLSQTVLPNDVKALLKAELITQYKSKTVGLRDICKEFYIAT